MIISTNSWQQKLVNKLGKRAIEELHLFLDSVYADQIIYPPRELVFNAFMLTPFEQVKIVILGQDPYFQPHLANGLAFSVNDGQKIPSSLKNIYKELHADLGIVINKGDLSSWAKQGVLLINSILTVKHGQPLSHNNQIWANFIDAVLSVLNEDNRPKVFIFWGNNAIAKSALITNKQHLILSSSHPSPLSARHSFFGCRHFSKANEFLRKHKIKEVDFNC